MGRLMELYERLLAQRANGRQELPDEGRGGVATAVEEKSTDGQSRPTRGGIDFSLPRGDIDLDDDEDSS